MSTITLYGIKNCDTVKKARKWLEQQGIDYRFHDFRADGLSPDQLKSWVASIGWETLVNKRSTTWKGLAPELRNNFDELAAVATMLEQPTLIKRPVLDIGHQQHVGFKAADYEQLFQQHTL